MRSRSVAVIVVLFVAAAGCSRTSSPKGSATTAQRVDETVAPQSIAPSGVDLTISPLRARAGTVHLRTTLHGAARAWTSAHVWLDRQTASGWETEWLLDVDGHSVSIDDYRRGAAPLTTVGIRVPGELRLTLSPAPPPGSYRVRVGVLSGPPESEGGETPGWATGTVEIG